VIEQPGFMGDVYNAMCMGSSIAEYAKTRNIRFDLLSKFVNQKDNKKDFKEALRMRKLFVVDILTDETLKIGVADIRRLYGDNGCLLPVNEFPDDVAGAVEAVESKETFEMVDGKRVWTGYTKKVKFNNKLKAQQLLGQEQGIFKERTVIEAGEKLSEMIEKSYKERETEKDA